MRFLRNTTLEEVDNIIERSSDRMLIYVNDAPAGTPSVGIVQGNDKLNITVKIFRGYSTPAATYQYNTFSPSTVLSDVIDTVFADHPDVNSSYSIYLGDYEFESGQMVSLNPVLTLSDLEVTNGSTLSFMELLA